MHTETQRMLPVKLSPVDLAQRAASLSHLVVQVAEEEAREKSRAISAKEEIKRLESQVMRLANVVRTGEERQLVDISRRPNAFDRKWEYYRDDTGELIETETMSEAEARDLRQMKLDLVAEVTGPIDPSAPVTASVQESLDAKVNRPRKTKSAASDEHCSNCGVERGEEGLRKGRCRPCADFLRRHGAERHVGTRDATEAQTEAH